jgi:putative aldouronate transport system substrate-binding protein
MLLQAKEELPDVDFLSYDFAHNDPANLRSMAYIFYRLYGGENIKAVNSEGEVHYGVRDEAYLKAVKFINSLYLDGLFNKENFTILKQEQLQELVENNRILSFWGQAWFVVQYDLYAEDPKYLAYEFPKVPGITPKLCNNGTGIGGGGVYISKNAKNPDRAIKYLEFVISDEGQMLTTHGLEGEHYEILEGWPRRTDFVQQTANEAYSSMTKDLGIYNYNITWLTQLFTDQMLYYWTDQENIVYRMNGAFGKYANNERLSMLTVLSADAPEKVIETKFNDLWIISMPKMYLADSESDCEAAYNSFIKQADTLGLAELEAAYTEVAKEWLKKIS